jgi:hypothetical protein
VLVLWHVANSVVRRLSYVQVVQCVCGGIRGGVTGPQQSSGMGGAVTWPQQSSGMGGAGQGHSRAVAVVTVCVGGQRAKSIFLSIRIGDGYGWGSGLGRKSERLELRSVLLRLGDG